MTPPLDPDSLVRAAVRRDVGTLETLLLWHYDALLNYVGPRLSQRDKRRFDAEDVVQQTCRNVFARLGNFDGQRTQNFEVGYLFVAATS